MSNGSGPLQPTFQGHVNTTHDALILFEACLTGILSHVPRRPHDRERSQLVKSGCVFIYEENASGIKRWTDGVPWSPSRILGNFLVYRELLKPFPPGEKKRATKRNKRPQRPGEPYPRSGDGSASGYSPENPSTPNLGREDAVEKEFERSLIGSLVDSYGFRDDGLVKKTMSVSVQGVQHHLVSYYKVADVKNGKLRTPSLEDRLRHIKPRYELVHKQNFRVPLADEMEELTINPDGIPRGPPPFYPADRAPPPFHPGYSSHPGNTGYYSSLDPLPYPGAHTQPAPIGQYSQTSHSHPYYPQQQAATQVKEEYGGYGTTGSYPPRYSDPYSAQPGIPNPSRTPSQPQQATQPMPYPHPSVNRPPHPESPMDQPYGRGSYYPPTGASNPQLQYDHQRRSTQVSSTSTTIRDGQPQPGAGYPSSDRNMWVNGAMTAQGQYSGSPPVSSQWSSSMA